MLCILIFPGPFFICSERSRAPNVGIRTFPGPDKLGSELPVPNKFGSELSLLRKLHLRTSLAKRKRLQPFWFRCSCYVFSGARIGSHPPSPGPQMLDSTCPNFRRPPLRIRTRKGSTRSERVCLQKKLGPELAGTHNFRIRTFRSPEKFG
jgi:hypothetical protein